MPAKYLCPASLPFAGNKLTEWIANLVSVKYLWKQFYSADVRAKCVQTFLSKCICSISKVYLSKLLLCICQNSPHIFFTLRNWRLSEVFSNRKITFPSACSWGERRMWTQHKSFIFIWTQVWLFMRRVWNVNTIHFFLFGHKFDCSGEWGMWTQHNSI